MSTTPPVRKTDIASAGHHVTEISARFSPQILALFSDHLYSSANKAFEELVTNSWDADATSVHVHLPENLHAADAAIYILDNGRSMDVDGFQQLWTIAESKKRSEPATSNRKKIGKFGIGKLATYILCNELTYICKAADGIVRVVTMDYRKIDQAKVQHLDSLALSVRELKDANELGTLLNSYAGGKEVFDLIQAGIPAVQSAASVANEFGGDDQAPAQTSDTWTLAILTSLKEKGKNLQRGWIRRLLSTALPLGNSMGIQVNDSPVEPSKHSVSIVKSWKLGPDLEFDSLDINGQKITLEKKDKPYPHINIPGIGEITGTITYFANNIAGGKSNLLETSNGFFVNVLGRVINYEDNQFKLPHLNHGVFSRLRVAIRVDGLDEEISISRESISDGTELSLIRSLLREIFNMVRREEARQKGTEYVKLGQVRKDEIKALPFAGLSPILEKAITGNIALPKFVSVRKDDFTEPFIQNWIKETKEGSDGAIKDIVFKEQDTDGEIATYDIASRTLVINQKHPFVKANSETKEQRELLRDVLTADLLADTFLLNSGIPPEVCEDYFWHRDRSRRLIAQIRRPSATMIIETLDDWKDKATPYEEIVGDALEFLGFDIERLAASGEPEGIATAYISPLKEDTRAAYSFSYDAKSTGKAKVQTGNVHIAGLARHRDAYGAKYALVVAPDFQDGALTEEAKSNRVTPMRGATLAKLVALTIGFGPISLDRLEEVFALYDPNEVDEWVLRLGTEMNNKTEVNLPTLITAIEDLVTPNKLDRLSCAVIAQKYRELSGNKERPTTTEITTVLQGLSRLMPTAIGISGTETVYILTRPEMLEREIKRQFSRLPDSYKLGALEMTQ